MGSSLHFFFNTQLNLGGGTQLFIFRIVLVTAKMDQFSHRKSRYLASGQLQVAQVLQV